MMNRIVSFSLLLFSFSLVLLGFQPEGEVIIFTISIPVPSIEIFRVLGIITLAASLILIIISIRERWSTRVIRFLDKKEVFFPTFIIFWGLYTISYIKGFAGVVEASQPEWIVYSVFCFGFALFLLVAWLGLKRLFE